MKKALFSLAILAFVAIMFTSCEEECNCPEQKPDNELSGDITGDEVLEASIEYTLNGSLRIKDGGKLTIPAGTVIKANKGFSKYILVERGGKIMINGTEALPVIMTSIEASPAAGDWGGLIINGYANISGSEAGTEGSTEIDPSVAYGGTNDADNSGSINYLILEYTGAKSSANVEHNGLTLNAVGNGTTIENVYVINGADDGIELFGGSVNVTNLLVVNSDDDMFDVTQGWSGTLKNAYGIWEAGYTSGEGDPRGIESDGNWDGLGPDHVGQSNYKMSNITIENKSTFEMHDAIKVRRGATATITNILVTGGLIKDLVDLTDSKGLSTDETNIAVTSSNNTMSGKDVNRTTKINEVDETCNATVTVSTSNTGADKTKFSWTKYSF